MLCYRKHSLFTKKYHIFKNENEILLGENITKIKYTINLTPQTIIDWSINQKTKQLNGFWLIWNNKQKLFLMDAMNCNLFKQSLNGIVTYGKYQILYEPINSISHNTFGQIQQLVKMRYLDSGDSYMCKTIQKSLKYTDEDFYYQFEILKQLDHSKILKLKEVYNTNNQYHFVFNYPEGGSLVDLIKSKQLPFQEVKLIIEQLMSTVSYIHSKGYVHRNLKPEHIYFQEPNNLETLVISEFELGCRSIDFQNKRLTYRVHGYSAPEIKQDIVTQKSDIFSCGVILYKIITRKDLFDHESNTYDEKMMLHLINQSDIDIQYQNLLRMMLQFNPELRATADQCLNIIHQLSQRTPYFSRSLDKTHIDTNSINNEIISINLIEDQDELSENQEFIQGLPTIQINRRTEMFY
ncbi:unnamed protein product (macronuclear) [Paramecium tetraurelia]|uniref:Protein kinase domain-containing protein n=1 Tax=Paramecium tetraurelia TaxID=5888 RepID=A0BFB5_PARTE|nr:uncharacterized protein GSPATT00028267001 [Paramecium tetraurelia]CAK57232.1 unnamed protein product [Paramecium tetraurelia]|eukprot:XP_001424630.1 hypothetical protein (macronuclear) [Paramecium tetraurelia strain d4-2]